MIDQTNTLPLSMKRRWTIILYESHRGIYYIELSMHRICSSHCLALACSLCSSINRINFHISRLRLILFSSCHENILDSVHHSLNFRVEQSFVSFAYSNRWTIKTNSVLRNRQHNSVQDEAISAGDEWRLNRFRSFQKTWIIWLIWISSEMDRLNKSLLHPITIYVTLIN